jgi:hypothetical protein
MEKPNRAERRKNRFGGGRATEHGGWPTHQPNPVFTGDAATEEPPTAKPAAKAKPDVAPSPDADDPAASKPAKG